MGRAVLGVIALAMLVLVGCGPSLTCAVLGSKDNCLAQAEAALAACIPMSTTPATISPDQMSCTWPDGMKVMFNAPAGGLWMIEGETCANLTFLYPNGFTCGTVIACNNVGPTVDIAVGGSNAFWSLDGNNEVSLQCPARTYTANASDVASCGGDAPGVELPPSGPPYMFSIGTALTFTCQ